MKLTATATNATVQITSDEGETIFSQTYNAYEASFDLAALLRSIPSLIHQGKDAANAILQAEAEAEAEARTAAKRTCPNCSFNGSPADASHCSICGHSFIETPTPSEA